MFNEIKLGIIRHKGGIWAAYLDNRRLEDSKSKKEALKRLLQEIDAQGDYFNKSVEKGQL